MSMFADAKPGDALKQLTLRTQYFKAPLLECDLWIGNQFNLRLDRSAYLVWQLVVGLLSRSATIKGGARRARESTFTVSTVPSQTLATKFDREGAESRGMTHHISDHRLLTATVTVTMSFFSSAQGIYM
jgi:hypothetical protein